MANCVKYDFKSEELARAFLDGIESADSDSRQAIGILPPSGPNTEFRACVLNYNDDDSPVWYDADEDFIVAFTARPENKGLILYPQEEY